MLDELLATDGVEEHLVLGGTLGVMALHGGLEAHTETVAARVAASTGASLYAIVQPDDHRWHIPSARHDPRHSPRLTSFLEHVRAAVSIHGFGRSELPKTILVGGSNERLRRLTAAALRRKTALTVLDDPALIPAGLRGLHPANPVNLPELGGVQVELSPGARTPETLGLVVDAISSVVLAESAGVCPA